MEKKKRVNQHAKMSLKDALDMLEKKHGEGTVMNLASGAIITKINTLPTGVYSLDKALGGGIARGRVTELFGSEGSGKTTMALQVIVEAQKKGMKAAYIDVEHSFNMEYARSLGSQTNLLYFAQPDSAEQAFDIAKTLAITGEFAVIVIDSVAALTPASEFEGDVGNSQIGHLARFMSQALKQVLDDFSKTDTALILINQTRLKIGIAYGNPITTPGGNAVKFYCTQRIQVMRSSKIENKEGQIVGHKTMIKIEKNKIAIPHQKAEIDFINGKGFDKIADIFNFGVKMGVITKEKITYFFNEEKLGIGEAQAKETVLSDAALQKRITETLEKLVIAPEVIGAQESDE